MSKNSHTKKKNLRHFNSRLKHNNGPDRVVENWKMIDVHEIPDNIQPNASFDFWCHDGRNLFLLTIKNAPEEKHEVFEFKGLLRLHAQLNFEDLNNEIIEKVVHAFHESQ